MTNDEAKFRLQGYRPNGADAENPAFAEALAQAQNDPALRTWFEREQAFDSVIAGKLRGVAVPDGLRESILAGTKLSETKPAPVPALAPVWWLRHWALGLAAAAAVALVATLVTIRPSVGESRVGVQALLQVALADYHGAHTEGKHADVLGAFGAWLQNPAAHLSVGPAPVELATLRADGCRTVDVAGHQVFEVCFLRDGGWYHVYLAPRGVFDPAELHHDPMYHEQGEFVAASWADEKYVYLLSSTSGLAALKRLL